jgi:hypothetical protein
MISPESQCRVDSYRRRSLTKLSIVRTNPNTCSLTLFHGKNGYWLDFAQRDKAATLSEK